jgi:hypothetical protein
MPTMGGDSGSHSGLGTARGRDWPGVRQFNVFVKNQIGGLARVVQHFETTSVRIVSISVVNSADCAIIRLVLSDPERAREILSLAELMFSESDLLIVHLPDIQEPLLGMCKSLLQAEINIHYAYPLLIGPKGSAALAMHVEDFEMAARILANRGFMLYTEDDLLGEEGLS